jgi:hypothetical protein
LSDTFTCPKCERTSHNSNDARAGYCGACHEFTGSLVKEVDGVEVTIHKATDWEHHEHGLDAVGYLDDGKDAAPIKRGERIVKVNSEDGDSYADGTGGTVVASIDLSPYDEEGFVYFVHFDPLPGVPTMIHSRRVKKEGT